MKLAFHKLSLQSLVAGLAFCLALLALFSAQHVRAEGDDDRHGMVNDIDLPTSPEALQNGKDRYQARCSYCHRPDGRGGSSGVKLASQKYKWGSKASDIFSTISAGRRYTKMGAFGNPETGLTPDEIFNVIAYIRTLQEAQLMDDKAAAKP
jgi:mono/diheme cytochrome c family protein